MSDINVLKPGLLEFIFYDNSKKKVPWQSKARKDWWTDEAKLAYSKKRSQSEFSRKIERFNAFSSFVKCGKCGLSYRRQTRYYKNGDQLKCFTCPSPADECSNSTINQSLLEDLVTEKLNLPSFYKEEMYKNLSHISIQDNKLTFHYKGGHEHTISYENPIRPKPKT
ncbi:zinc ribbon domain-containing protein [Facklamia sp. P12950]|uniref:zinc ribbon domain-containing protein n=1 Tax=Facklamia sp. P12950 TaxID=3421951 RepID=UPI003D176300